MIVLNQSKKPLAIRAYCVIRGSIDLDGKIVVFFHPWLTGFYCFSCGFLFFFKL